MNPTTDITTVLVANRGEIALRVLRTCADLGLATVAVHTAGDADAPHVRAADVAAEVPAYLDGPALVAAALAHGATAVHPGYGFLSENAAFARAVAEAGLVWVGPSADVIERMGRKDHARAIAEAADVPVVPAYDVADDPTTFDFPVLVKAAAGGGGKGMRVVRSADAYGDAVAAARREAAAGFGDDTLLVERYVERGRHVEVQVMGDAHGTVLHLFERDCSAQRRHQKVLEEAPAPHLTDAVRARLHTAAVALAAEVGYTGAGTVEFLLDVDTDDVFFLEMNTRLQVEHPVTESVVVGPDGPLDLVALQLRVAAGRPLGLAQGDLRVHGHAVEARVYAEDAWAGFLPQAGTASYVAWPGTTGEAAGTGTRPRVRVDHALESGQVVSTSFDPMLGKVIAWGTDRRAAIAALVRALDDTVVLGLTTNTGFLRALAASDAFAALGAEGGIDTAWLDRHEVDPPDEAAARRAVLATLAARDRAATAGPFALDGWRSGAGPAPYVVPWLEPTSTEDDAPPPARTPRVAALRRTPGGVEAVVDGQRWVFAEPDPFALGAAAAGDGTLTAPMPGTVVTVDASVGDVVVEGQVLATMEAMKMELSLRAPFAGTVTDVAATPGTQVPLGTVLVVVAPEE
ncbi:acetyl/propionyl/methylcrotonyl-CoA carboxylase subunit alpha [Nocardioides alkalitolerans]|uniref:acetyl/propionyl/methylcrotonyl-CoA carboxylase subunit alpha n=1 Tax=Nocardioides alkalitolerans TaxID=281714 RepID=UPI00041EDB49|nr:biotin carboxylase N-terminal domain-containing protein [Nocardioides alkalitolerans]